MAGIRGFLPWPTSKGGDAGHLAGCLRDRPARCPLGAPVGTLGRNTSRNNLGAASHFCRHICSKNVRKTLCFVPSTCTCHFLRHHKVKDICAWRRTPGCTENVSACFSKPPALQVGIKAGEADELEPSLAERAVSGGRGGTGSPSSLSHPDSGRQEAGESGPPQRSAGLFLLEPEGSWLGLHDARSSERKWKDNSK